MKSLAGGQGVVAVTRPKVLDFVALVKPELTFLSLLTALAGFSLGTGWQYPPLLFLSTFLGTALVGGGAGALNQLIEREHDALMRRTQNRPLPSGRLSPLSAGLFGTLLSLAGISVLFAFVNPLTAFLATATLATYLFLYTPLKRLTPFSTIVGAVAGALPPVMGWTAGRNEFGMGAWELFAMLFLWQIPHFLSLAWIYRKDYERAGYRLLTVLDIDGSRTALQITVFAAGLIPASVLLGWGMRLGTLFTVGGVVLGIGNLISTIYFMRNRLTPYARTVFIASLFYLLGIMFLLAIGRLSVGLSQIPGL